MYFTPEKVEKLESHQVFIFGSNANGNHAGGAASLAVEKFGAIEGQAEGLQGQSYGFITLDKKMKKVPLKTIKEQFDKLFKLAKEYPGKEFILTKVGCGIAGFSEEQIKKCFDIKQVPTNVVMPVKWKPIKAYKAFNLDMTCKDMKYKIGETYSYNGTPIICQQGLHFCFQGYNVYNYYSRNQSIVCEVEVLGDIDMEYGGDKGCTNKLKVIRQLTNEEKGFNTGDMNTGYMNTGDMNTGYMNTGDRNTGDMNTGDMNTGYMNTGDRNTGYMNTGDRNTGYMNTGYMNTGDRNTGDMNTGYMNTGDMNTGDRNTGDMNTGYRNTGYMNTGDRNTGDMNTGNWNKGNRHSGFLNTGEAPTYIFNKIYKGSINNIEFPYFFNFETTEWIYASSMTEQEKKDHPSYITAEGYLKTIPTQEAWRKAWDNATQEDKRKVLKLPNFNNKIFKEISGIDVKKELG